MSDDLGGIRHVLALARDRGFAEVAVESGDLKFKATLGKAAKRSTRKGPAPGEEAAPLEAQLDSIRSPLVGYFKSLDSGLEAGQVVEAGQSVGVVLSLGEIPYAVESAVAGEIVEVLVQNDQPVEYGQVIAKIKP